MIPQTERALARIHHMRAAMHDVLADGNWHSMEELAKAGGGAKRTVGFVVEMFPTDFITSRTDGYKLLSRATRDEREHALAMLRATARSLTVRANALEGACDVYA